MFWLRNRKIKFLLHTLNLSPGHPDMVEARVVALFLLVEGVKYGSIGCRLEHVQYATTC